MKKIYFFCVALATATVMRAQTTIAQWNFNDGTTNPVIGSGTANVLGVTGAPSFVSGTPASGKAWRTSGFPAQGVGSGTAGFGFAVSTQGYTGISVSVDITGTNTGSRYFQMQYTINGSTWNNVGSVITIQSTSVSGWTSVNNTIPADANNDADFAVRLVSVFSPGNNTEYKAIGASSTYNSGGAMRVDNVSITGTPVSLAISDVKKLRPNFIKETFIKSDDISFRTSVKDVKIFNMNGQLVKKGSVNVNETLNISELPKGNYIVTGTISYKLVSQKILKD
ncbi:hypothetical protein CEY12_10835 [Chryseobacterium sp. T16E-39]|uniref:T9SS type A sorting domain-containing protein n=1 Tax=Chryseobacterium sp. T16E-39 TaxID=2015076 RepID=UPI000B5B48D1|nr:T9SS type A sorting domain-containing protein [Chryseobacterium sp. T16E-39]ASK30574.1 hypothetical protein CEY12_10835 [Chryseobacterium sp. T16E-39]